jgi:hypothetical protein
MTLIRSAVRVFVALAVVLLTVQAALAQPCTPVYSTGCTFGDGLTLFQLNIIDQTIPCTGSPSYYHDFTSTSTQLQPGTAYTLTVQAGYSSTYVTVWVDLDNNDTFDSTEVLVSTLYCASAYTNYQTTLTIPIGTSVGDHRLRFRTSWLFNPTDPCGSVTYGNSADFTVNVPAELPSTVSGTVSYTGLGTGPIGIAAYDGSGCGSGNLIEAWIPGPGPYTLDLSPGTYYICACRDTNGNGTCPDSNEPASEYDLNPVVVPAGALVTGIDISLQGQLLQPEKVPTMTEWGVMILIGLLGIASICSLRRQWII